MELWIRSQNKKVLLKISTLEMLDEDNSIYTAYLDKVLKLGKYATKERALEVLNKISKLVENAMYHTQLNNEILFYQMPKE